MFLIFAAMALSFGVVFGVPSEEVNVLHEPERWRRVELTGVFFVVYSTRNVSSSSPN